MESETMTIFTRMKTPAILLMLVVQHCCIAATETNFVSVGEWSNPVSDSYGYRLRGRLLLCQVPWRGPASTPDIGVYLELEEISDFSVAPVQVLCDLSPAKHSDGLLCELRYTDGRPVAEGGIYSGGVPGSCWITLPAYSSIRLKVSGGTAKATQDWIQITLSRQSWAFPSKNTNDCFLSGTFTVNPPAELVTPYTPSNYHVWKGTLTLPAVRIPVKRLKE